MKCGCPVICSNTTSLPEIVGNAAIKVNTLNPKEIVEAMEKVLRDKKLMQFLQKKGINKKKELIVAFFIRHELNIIASGNVTKLRKRLKPFRIN